MYMVYRLSGNFYCNYNFTGLELDYPYTCTCIYMPHSLLDTVKIKSQHNFKTQNFLPHKFFDLQYYV